MSEYTILSPWLRIRIIITTLIFVGLFGFVIRKAHRLQIVEGSRLREMAEQQYLKAVELPSRRGTIYDRNGSPLALSVEVDSIYANPRMIGDSAVEVGRALSKVLGLDPYVLQKQLAVDRYFAWVKRRVSSQEAKQVRSMKIRGIFLTKESRRFYPNRGLGSTVVGFAGTDSRGLEGIELSFDKWLKGSPMRVSGLRDAMGRHVFNEGAEQNAPSNHDLRLTIDKSIQFETEQALAEAYKEVRPQTGWVAAVVMNPQNGDILAMGSAPSFDPNQYKQAKPWQWRNHALADAFEPGSTLKVFSVATALEVGAIRPQDVFYCERGRWRVGRYTIHDTHPHDRLDVAGILQKSSNIGVSKIALRLGKDRLYQGLKQFGYGQKLGLELPGARAGLLYSPKRWSDVALSNISFGQGMTTTVLHIAQSFSAIANGGVMMRPRLVLSIRNNQGKTIREFPLSSTAVLSKNTADRLLTMLTGVTEPGGTGTAAALEHFTVAGKTGTAQKVDPVTRSYSTDRWVSSFVGVVPATSPRLVIAVVMNEPGGDKHYGGEVAGPIFKRIAEQALAYLGVKPDKLPKKEEKFRSKSEPLVAEGYIDEAHSDSAAMETVVNDSNEMIVPDFTGMSLVEVVEVARKQQMKLELDGSGVAVSQSPGPGPASRKMVCRVSFRPPG